MASFDGVAFLDQSDDTEKFENLTRQIDAKKGEFDQLKEEKEKLEMTIQFYKMQLYKLTEIRREETYRTEYNFKLYKQIKEIYGGAHKIGFLLEQVEWEKIHKYDELPMLEHKNRIEELDCQAKQQVEQMENRSCVIQLRAAQEKYIKILDMQNQFKKNQAQHKISLAMKVGTAEQKRNSHIVALIAITKRVNEFQLKLQEKFNSTETCNNQTQMQFLSSDPVFSVSEQVPQINLPNQPIPIKKNSAEDFSLSKPLSNAKNQSSFKEKQPFESVFKTPLAKPISKAENTNIQIELKQLFEEIDCDNFYQSNESNKTLNVKSSTSTTNLDSTLYNPLSKQVATICPVPTVSSAEKKVSSKPINEVENFGTNIEEMDEGKLNALQEIKDDSIEKALPISSNQVANARNMQPIEIGESQRHSEYRSYLEEDDTISNVVEAQSANVEAMDNKILKTMVEPSSDTDATDNFNPTKSNEVNITVSNETGVVVDFSSGGSDLDFTCDSPNKSTDKKSNELSYNDLFDNPQRRISNDEEFFQYNSADCEIKSKRGDYFDDFL